MKERGLEIGGGVGEGVSLNQRDGIRAWGSALFLAAPRQAVLAASQRGQLAPAPCSLEELVG